jgi:Rps23 Pro-64 3,4-dihydroxylase Tpa1-like proline 4-hydroxylase
VYHSSSLILFQVQQTGDLASLSYLDPEQLALLPGLLRLRDALYSPDFRNFVRAVTGCGAISGKKQDMSVNTYKQGCHLLNHDDVIGTRRVSYILYMPLPVGTPWDPSWGGALELYDTQEGPSGVLEPKTAPMTIIPPKWNQFIFFEVQPGHSFHSVEEVVVEFKDGRERLSVSGWFHAAQEGEEGYDPTPVPETQSSLEQLVRSRSYNYVSCTHRDLDNFYLDSRAIRRRRKDGYYTHGQTHEGRYINIIRVPQPSLPESRINENYG